MQLNATSAHEEFLDLRELIFRLWARRWWLIAGTALFVGAAIIYALTTERVYRATVVLAQAESQGGGDGVSALLSQVGGLASLAGISLGAQGANVEEALAVLRSRDFTVRFFEEDKILPKFFPESWDQRAQSWKQGEKPPSISRAYVYFDNDVRRIVQNRKTGLISLHIEWTDRVEAARWANELVRRLNDEMRARAINDANLAVRYLEEELRATSTVEVRAAINRLIEAQIKHRMLANVNQEYAFRIIDRAVVPEPDEAVKPRRVKIVFIGAVLGFMLTAIAVVLVDYFRQGRPVDAAT